MYINLIVDGQLEKRLSITDRGMGKTNYIKNKALEEISDYISNRLCDLEDNAYLRYNPMTMDYELYLTTR